MGEPQPLTLSTILRSETIVRSELKVLEAAGSSLASSSGFGSSGFSSGGGSASSLKSSGFARSTLSVVEQLKTDLQARETPQGTLITLPGDVLFDFDKWNIRSDAEATLNKVVQLITETKPKTVRVEGHTDAKGSDDYNFRLSDRRAASVKTFLLKGADLPPSAIATKGLGETTPVAPNATPSGGDDPEGRQRNRRVEIFLK